MPKRTFLNVTIPPSQFQKFIEIGEHLQDKINCETVQAVMRFPPPKIEEKTTEETKSFSIEVSKELRDEIKKEARECGMTMTQYFIEIVENGYAKYFPPSK